MASYNPTDLNALEHAEASAEAKLKHASQVEDADFKWLMSSKRGRRIVWRLLERAGVFRTTFTSNSMQTAFNEGMRNYGVVVLAQVHELTPEQYPLMLKEHKEHVRSADD